MQIGNDLFVGCIRNVTIGDYVPISSRVSIADSTHDYRDVKRPVTQQDVPEGLASTIAKNAFTDVNVCILPGIRIGKNAEVGAGPFETGDGQP